jgi:NitT/TauT family transport system substrate-binding protein
MKRDSRTKSGIATKYVAVGIVVLALAVAAGYGALSLTSSAQSSTTTTTSAAPVTSTSTTTQSSSTSSATTSSASTSTATSTSAASSSVTTTSTTTSSTTSSSAAPPLTLPATSPTSNSGTVVRIGYFANLNHGPAVIGLNNGDFQKFVGPSTTIQTTLFTSGSPEMTALLAGKIDIAYVGPSPAVNSYIASSGTALQIVSGVANGGAVFVVTNASGLTTASNLTPGQLKGMTFAAPGVGNTQDIALRHYLQVNGYGTAGNGGSVIVDDTANANIVALMEEGQVDGAWVPEPWGAIIVADSASHIFLNEQSLWPNGFSTTELVVASSFLQAHPDVVREIITANLYETQWIQNNPQQADVELNNYLGNLTGSAIGLSIIQSAITRLSFTDSPLEPSVLQQAQNAYELGDLGSTPPTSSNLAGLYNLTILNSVLSYYGLTQVTDQGARPGAVPPTAANLLAVENLAALTSIPKAYVFKQLAI